MSLFVDEYDGFLDSDEEEMEGVIKRRRLDKEDKQEEEDKDDKQEEESSSDTEWEDIPLGPTPNPESFIIPIHNKTKNYDFILQKKKRLSIHHLSLVSYMLHGLLRNRLINHPSVVKTLKKLAPHSIKSKLKRLLKQSSPSKQNDIELIYVLKYLIKWFRLNFKITSNGLRVLGYCPNDKYDKYFTSNSAKFNDIRQFCSLVKKFQHNRDLAAQLFCGLLRSLGLETRLVFSLPVLPVQNPKLQPKLNFTRLANNKDFDLLYPYFWTEVVNPFDSSEIIILETCAFHDEEKRLTRVKRYSSNPTINNAYTPIFCPVKDQFNQMTMSYVVSYDNNNLVTDISSRYMSNISFRWFNKLDLKTELGRSFLLYQSIIRSLNSRTFYINEDLHNRELDTLRYLGLNNFDLPTSLSHLKRNNNVTSKASLRYNEVIDDNAKPLAYINLNQQKVPVYFKNSIIVGKSELQWKFLGRSVKPDQLNYPIKLTKSLLPRTIARKRIHNVNALNDPEKNEVSLYSFQQTCPYIKDKALISETGIKSLPRNKYGNIEIFRDSMIPDNCTWLKLSHIEKILTYQDRFPNPINEQVQFVPVVTGFNFRKYGYAIPIKCGVLILEEQTIIAKKIWLYGQMYRQKLLQKKKNLTALKAWNYFHKRLKIIKRIDNGL